VIDPDAQTYGGIYFDIAKAVKVASGMDLPGDAAHDIKDAKALKAIGASAIRENDRVARATLKLSFN
jgi:hypothetical protein